jgi:transcriptional regulator GlxA family with amidase domain
MTSNPEILPSVPAADPLAGCALFVAFEGMGLLDLTGPLTVFWSATLFMEQQGLHGYARHTVSLDGGPIRTAEGVRIETTPISAGMNLLNWAGLCVNLAASVYCCWRPSW